MTKIITLLLKRYRKFPASIWLILSILTVSIASTWQSSQASTPRNLQPAKKPISQRLAAEKYAQNAPAQLTNLLTQIDAAANQGDVKKVIEFYSPNFTHGDGLNRQTLEKALIDLWKRYPKLRYTTQLQSWRTEGNVIVAETVTNISGLPSANSNNMALNATIKSRQRISGGKIVRQDILTERTLLTSGSKPPQVDVKLPQQVRVGQQYNFDAIVQEPLGDEFLLGTAIEEPIQADKYLNPTPVDLELLNSGGLFKVGRAPSTPGSQWLSAVILRGDGMTMITQRLQVVKK
ncbi:nuclear transport factor 2 family protein [Calothrix sp. FACHB-1219]|uniref:nuclear transport factor 2 family protein n=1 Tax=unclassified Calothrix TaxID=2619626 RepID=UPI001687C889|nr:MULTISPECIES: nuclear transport factor 2 family protein [unclassified Calothrix]MBD2203787.1 nuclear transport factor 2 family protein [Calothrix sp. FACHB-168]MBD2219606.1 nuclear transport factor 2 family protein [Calothrix sp. FACHB-1219]